MHISKKKRKFAVNSTDKMRQLAQIITQIIDFFYPPFRRFIPQQIFRYGACGGGNMVLDWVLYFVMYNFVVGHENVYIGSLCISPHILSLCIVFPITLLTGFLLNKYITFTQSDLRGRKQLMRYMVVVAINLAINYFGLKLCVDILSWYPTPSKIFVTLITVFVSFFGQKYYSFRKG